MKRRILVFFFAILIGSSMLFPGAYADETNEANEDAGDPFLQENDEGDDVISLQLRLADLGYYNYKITNFFGEYTERALKDFQKENGLPTDGVLGEETSRVLFSNAAKRRPVEEVKKVSSSSSSGSSASRSSTRTGKLLDWWDTVSSIFSRGETARVIDVETGITFQVKRFGGTNHADSEPLTSKDTAAMKEAYGGEWSWNRRAIVVEIDGYKIAASMNGQPHSSESIKDNDFDGHFCIHFLNSRTHINNAVDSAHQEMVHKAAGE